MPKMKEHTEGHHYSQRVKANVHRRCMHCDGEHVAQEVVRLGQAESARVQNLETGYVPEHVLYHHSVKKRETRKERNDENTKKQKEESNTCSSDESH